MVLKPDASVRDIIEQQIHFKTKTTKVTLWLRDNKGPRVSVFFSLLFSLLVFYLFI